MEKAFLELLNSPEAFSRMDENDDRIFYDKPRLTQHLDETALTIIEKIIDNLIDVENPTILDLMASVDSHVPDTIKPKVLAGLGMNKLELEANEKLNLRIIQDINQNPYLPFTNEVFDTVIITVSIQYLTQPEIVFSEIARILKSKGVIIVIFSNRLFEEKAVRVWQLLTDDEKISYIDYYIQRCVAFGKTDKFISMGLPRPVSDKYYRSGQPSDPIYAIYAYKGKNAESITKPNINSIKQNKRINREIIAKTLVCPYCGEKLHLWKITENPMTSWDHDIYICANDSCSYVVNGWRVMFDQGNHSVSYRFCFDPKSKSPIPIPIPNLKVIKDELG